jgi:hypothetical protein
MVTVSPIEAVGVLPGGALAFADSFVAQQRRLALRVYIVLQMEYT